MKDTARNTDAGNQAAGPIHSEIRELQTQPADVHEAPDSTPYQRLVGVARSVPGLVVALGLIYVLVAYGVPLLMRLL